MRPIEDFQRGWEPHRIELGCLLQRLFSTFPNSWPGAGLLLLRTFLAIALLYSGVTGLLTISDTIVVAQELIAAAGGLLLLAGLWTPMAGALVTLDEAWIAFSSYVSRRGDAWFHISLAILAACVAMLGPGAWSIDARLFGRKRFDVDRPRRKDQSL